MPGVIQATKTDADDENVYTVSFADKTTGEYHGDELIGPGFQTVAGLTLKAGQRVYVTYNGREVSGAVVEHDVSRDEVLISIQSMQPQNQQISQLVQLRKRLEEVRLLESRKSARLQDLDTDYSRLAEGQGELRRRAASLSIDVPASIKYVPHFLLRLSFLELLRFLVRGATAAAACFFGPPIFSVYITKRRHGRCRAAAPSQLIANVGELGKAERPVLLSPATDRQAGEDGHADHGTTSRSFLAPKLRGAETNIFSFARETGTSGFPRHMQEPISCARRQSLMKACRPAGFARAQQTWRRGASGLRHSRTRTTSL